jgi:cytochrome c biogenesis protein CcdA
MACIDMDLSIILILLTAFGLGLGHSLDPDHVLAVSTLLCNNKSLRKSISSAAVWGVGHSAVLFIIGMLVLILSVVIPPTVLILVDCAAGILLIVLGVLVIRPLVAEKVRPQQVTSREDPVILPNRHSDDRDHMHTHLHKSAVTGALQGLGGSAALMLVTLSTVNSVEVGTVFIFLFGVGVVLGMVGIACLVGSVIAYTASNLEKVHKVIIALTGSASIFFGIVIIASALI